MYAYSKKYNTSEIWFLYPVNGEMREHEQISFYSGDNTVVKVYFIDVENIEENLLSLFKKIDTTLV